MTVSMNKQYFSILLELVSRDLVEKRSILKRRSGTFFEWRNGADNENTMLRQEIERLEFINDRLSKSIKYSKGK